MNLETGHGIFEKNLALRFERQTEGSLVVKMHNIDPSDPKRQFYFSVRVEDDTNLYNGKLLASFLALSARAHIAFRNWRRRFLTPRPPPDLSVAECAPAVEGLPELVEQLNASNNLSLFVRRVRKAWVDALPSPHAARPARNA